MQVKSMILICAVLISGCSVKPLDPETIKVLTEQCAAMKGYPSVFNTPLASHFNCFKEPQGQTQ